MSRIRTFLAVPLPAEIRDKLTSLQRQLAQGTSKITWTQPENLHVTLIFLGDVSAEEVPAICKAAQEASSSIRPFEARVRGVGSFPDLRRPRILWAGISEGTDPLRELFDLISLQLEPIGFRREERIYTPHVTIGRVRQSQHGLAELLQSQTAFDAGTTTVEEVHIYSSELTPKGSLYTVMGRARLGEKKETSP